MTVITKMTDSYLSKIGILYLAVHPRLQIEFHVLLLLDFSSYFLVFALEPSADLREQLAHLAFFPVYLS